MQLYKRLRRRNFDIFTTHYIKLLKEFLDIRIAVDCARIYSKATVPQIEATCQTILTQLHTHYETEDPFGEPTNPNWSIHIIIKRNFSPTLARKTLTTFLNATTDPNLTTFVQRHNETINIGWNKRHPKQWFIVGNDITLNDLRATIATIAIRHISQCLPHDKRPIFTEYIEPLGVPYLEGNLNQYITLTDKIYEHLTTQGNSQESVITTLIDFMRNSTTQKIHQIENNISAHNRVLRDLERQYADTLADIQRQHITLNGLLATNTTDALKTSIERIFTYPTIKSITTKDNNIQIIAEVPVNNYNATDLGRILTSAHSCDHYHIGKEDKTVLTNVFIDKKYTLVCRNRLNISITDSDYNAKMSSSTWLGKTTPYANPHLSHHNCFGNNAPLLRKAISNYEFPTAVEIFIAAVGNINFADTTVFGAFIRDLKYQNNCNKTFKNNTTGEMLTYKEVYAEIMREKENNEQEETPCPED